MSEFLTRRFPWLLLVICAVTYAGLINNDFMIDDTAFMRGSGFDTDLQSASDFLTPEGVRHFFPLYLFLNLAKHRLFPEFPAAHHLINLGLFFAVCLLLYKTVFRLTNDRFVSVLTSIFFCIHPINGDNLSHADIANSLLAGAVMVWIFLCLLNYLADKTKPWWYWLGVVSYLVPVSCGEPALLFPLYVFLFLFVALKQSFKESLKLAAPFLVIALIVFAIWMILYAPSGHAIKGLRTLNAAPHEALATMFYLTTWYTKTLLYPGPVFLIHNFSPIGPEAGIWLIFMVFCAGSVVYLVKRWGRGVASFALLWYCAGWIYAFPASLAHPALGFVLEPYWLFFPTMGAILLIVLILRDVRPRIGRRIFALLLGAIIALWFVRTQEKNYIADTEALYAYHWLKACPGNLIAGLIISSYYETEDVDIPREMIPEMMRLIEIYYRTGTFDRAEKLNEKLNRSMHKPSAPQQ